MSTGNKYSGDGGIMQEMGGGNDGLAPSERHLEEQIVQPEPKREFIEFNAVKAAEKHLRKLYGGAS